MVSTVARRTGQDFLKPHRARRVLEERRQNQTQYPLAKYNTSHGVYGNVSWQKRMFKERGSIEAVKTKHLLKSGGERLLRLADSDDVMDEEDRVIRKKITSDSLEDDAESEGPITEDSDEHDAEADEHEPGVSKPSTSPREEEGDSPGEKHESEQGQAKSNEEEEDEDDDDDDDEEQKEDEEDDDSSSHEGKGEEGEEHHASQKPQQTGHENVDSHLSDEVLKMTEFLNKQDATSGRKVDAEFQATLESQRLQALNNQIATERAAALAAKYAAQMTQQMVRPLQLRHENRINQNSAILPVYYIQRPTAELPVNVPALDTPTVGIIRPVFMYPSPTPGPRSQPDSPGYSINVDGLQGFFAKTPGMALRFQSPDSEVTVTKKKDMVEPLGTTLRRESGRL